ncbi:MAG: hypothetical protein HYY02_08005 [Chloroflexi bacterium]|nr:hypothetical protein [Chloroflexota bacterium]
MAYLVAWWLTAEALALLALPYAWALFGRLPDRGLAFTKPLGLLLLGYLVWLSGSLRLLPNGRGAALLFALLLALGGLLLLRQQGAAMAEFCRRNFRLILLYEAAFAGAFLAWAVVRAFNPQIEGTEKPMDFALLNTALRATAFSPPDPWLSGYSVNYYYFGYLLMATLAQLTATPPAVAYNLALAFLFAAAAVGAGSLVANLVTLHAKRGAGDEGVPLFALAYGGAGALLLLGMGNLEGLLELLHAHGLGGDDLWRWLNIKGLADAPPTMAWHPTEPWWWWRATRIIDTVVNGQSLDYTITEFPFFSFLLGDLHPHVMGIPFVLLVVALSLNTYLEPGAVAGEGVTTPLLPAALPPLLLGSLGFINGWDLAPYLLLFLAAGALRTWRDMPRQTVRPWMGFGLWAGGTALGALLLYLPFYGGLGAQVAQSALAGQRDVAVAGFPLAWWDGPGTRPAHFLLLWAPLLFLAGSLLLMTARRHAPASGRPLAVVLVGVPAVWLLIEAGRAWLPPDGTVGAAVWLLPRVWYLGPLALGGALLLSRRSQAGHEEAGTSPPLVVPFVLLLAVEAVLLVAASESFRIRDVFGNRMNTVFKLYYQVWLLLAVAGGFTVYFVHARVSSAGRRGWSGPLWMGALALLVAGSCVYSVAALLSKTEAFVGPATLDGLAYLQRLDPEEAEALQWLGRLPREQEQVVLEATGGQYTRFGRVASSTGIPTLLGWAGHEVQWRGSDVLLRGRAEDIDRIYAASDKTQVLSLLERYGVGYVYVGAVERGKYPPEALAAFEGPLAVAFKNAGVVIYKSRGASRTG